MTTIMIYCNMGNQKQYLPTGGFRNFLYEDNTNWPIVNMNGLHAKVIKEKSDPLGDHFGLPSCANTSDMYFRMGKDGTIIQGKVYIGRHMTIDFDWSHEHVNKISAGGDGRHFPKEIVHVQVYRLNDKGEFVRLSNNARYMNNKEMKLYGPLIKFYNPNVRFRPTH